MNELVKDQNGKVSSMRIAFLFTTIFVVVIWGVLSLKNMTLLSLPDNVLYLIGVLATGKVGQKTFEKKEPAE